MVRHVVLKKILSRDWWEAAGEIDDEVMQLTALHAQFDTTRPRFKAGCALPLRLPIPRVLGLYVEDEPTLLGIQTRVCGFYMERYHCSLADFVADGPPTQLEFFRIVQGVAVALAAIHAQGTTSHERRLAERAGPHLGGSHRDVKPGNILLRVRCLRCGVHACGATGALACSQLRANASACIALERHVYALMYG